MFHQKVGGSIGLRCTGTIAWGVMAMTDRRMKAKMDKDGVDTKLYARYVDDGRTLMHPIKAGWRWSEGESRMVWSDEQEANDTMNSARTSRTARAMKDIVTPATKHCGAQ